MKWQPIETYDRILIEDHPKHAAFFFEATEPARRGGMSLSATVQLTRYFGSRVCPHFGYFFPCFRLNIITSGTHLDHRAFCLCLFDSAIFSGILGS